MTTTATLASAATTAECVRTIEQAWGDPWEPTSPLGLEASLAADERAESLSAGQSVLAGLGIAGEFVPAAYGGRLTALARMTQILRSVARRDTALAFSLASSAVLAAGPIWRAGSAQQRARAADLLLTNRILACAPRDLLRAVASGPMAIAGPTGWSVHGGQGVIGVPAAEAVVLLPRRQDGTGNAAPLMLEMSDLLAAGARVPEVRRSPGLPGITIGELTLSHCSVDAESAVGDTDISAHDAARIARTVIPSMMIGIVDTALRVTLRYAGRRRLYDGTVLSFPRTRAILADIFADLLICDALCGAAVRALHFLPDHAGRYTAVVQLLVAPMLVSAMTALSELLGASFFIRDGEFGIVQKLLRDVRTIAFEYSSSRVMRNELRAWPSLRATATPALHRPSSMELFAPDERLPEFDFTRPLVSTDGDDPIIDSLMSFPEAVDGSDADAIGVRELASWFRTRAGTMRDAAGRSVTADAASGRSPVLDYASMIAAGSCLGTWLGASGSADFRSDPAWIWLALTRIAHGLGHRRPIPVAVRERVVTELIARGDQASTFDLGNYRTTI